MTIDDFKGIALLSESKSRSLGLMLLCAKYRQVSTTLCLYHQCQKIKEAASVKVCSCLLFTFGLRNRTLNKSKNIFLVVIKQANDISQPAVMLTGYSTI